MEWTSKKLLSILVVVSFFSIFNFVNAEVVINEVQLSPTEERFLELYNTGNEIVDLTGWYIQRKTLEGTTFTSLISKTNFEGKTIGANDYFVISRVSFSNSDIVLGTLTLTESNTIQVKNTAGEVVNVVCWGENCSEGSNPTEGRSIQKNGNLWTVSDPTRGIANQSSSVSSNNDEEDNTSSEEKEDSSVSTTSKVQIKLQKPKVQIISTKLAHIGVSFVMEGTGTNREGEKLSHGRYYWNFGDGDFREVKVTNNEKFTHTYFYPGEYEVIFEHYPDFFTDVPDASAVTTIKVVEPKVVISNVGDANDFFIEITNETGHNADISSWKILSNYKVFTFPKNTSLASKKKMIISPRISGFNIEDKNTLKLMTPEGELASSYSSPLYKTISKTTSQDVVVKNTSGIKVLENTQIENEEENVKENLSALALNSNVFKEKDSNSSLLMYILFILFIGFSAFLVYFIRRKKVVTDTGDDFEILDE